VPPFVFAGDEDGELGHEGRGQEPGVGRPEVGGQAAC
jgi:hypothetical protein